MHGAVGLKGLLFLITVLSNLTAILFLPSHINERLPKALGPVSAFLITNPITCPSLINSATFAIV